MKQFITLLIIAAFLMFNSCCQPPADKLAFLSDYKPGNEYLKPGMINLHFIMETSSISKVDSVFKKLIERNDLPLTPKECADGEYKGVSPYDAFDYRHVAELTINEGKIVGIDYDEIHRNGKGKQEDEAYCQKMKKSGTTPAYAYPTMEAQLLSSQNLQEVDALAGATYSLYRFRYATILALIKAEMGE
ncbi:MAG: hypothetical protein K9I94_11470 [Bacteroidales bacterium]|nr:hypothetical protein [Bacteroidales bacterium]